MSRIGIVSDSTCDLGPSWCEEHDVVMVPLKVTFGDETFLDWIDLSPSRFYDKLRAAETLPKTSQPSPAEFAEAYSRLAAEGCSGIVSLHLSGAISGTIESANVAAGMVDVPVRIVDTHSASVGVALPLIAAVDARSSGADLDGVEEAATAAAGAQHTLFALDTLEYLVKGGRAGKAQGLAASMLSIKLVLMFDADGVIGPYKKVKGTKKAIQEIAAAVAGAGADGTVRVGLVRGETPEPAEELAAAIDATGAKWERVADVRVGGVIGTYVGPRVVGAAFYVRQ